jgi:hypothetical protein
VGPVEALSIKTPPNFSFSSTTRVSALASLPNAPTCTVKKRTSAFGAGGDAIGAFGAGFAIEARTGGATGGLTAVGVDTTDAIGVGISVFGAAFETEIAGVGVSMRETGLSSTTGAVDVTAGVEAGSTDPINLGVNSTKISGSLPFLGLFDATYPSTGFPSTADTFGNPIEFEAVRNPPRRMVFPCGIWMSCLIGNVSKTTGARLLSGAGPFLIWTDDVDETAIFRFGKALGVTSKVMPTS